MDVCIGTAVLLWASSFINGHCQVFNQVQYHTASFYCCDRLISSGERYKPMGMTVASKELPIGTRLGVYDLETHRTAIVTVNDRGPYIDGRSLDFSLGAAKKLHMEERGVIKVAAVILRDEPWVSLGQTLPLPTWTTLPLVICGELTCSTILRIWPQN